MGEISNPRSTIGRAVVAMLALVAAAFGLYSTNGADEATPVTETVEQEQTDDAEQEPSDADEAVRFSNLPTVNVDDLPAEAIDTLDLIFSGGPYPFERDDLVFQNREEILPDRARGHYREYTVITPGESDRGARRIVAGEDNELYYTSDHYQSFHEIVGI